MENNEVINGTELEEIGDACEVSSTKKVLAYAGASTILIVAGYATWRFVIKPLVAKAKAKRAARTTEEAEDKTVED